MSTVRARLAYGWLGHSTCKTSRGWLENSTFRTSREWLGHSTPFLPVSPFKNQSKRKVRKSDILAPNYYLKPILLESVFKNILKMVIFIFLARVPNLFKILNPQDNCCAQIPLVAFKVYTLFIIYICFRKIKEPKRDNFTFHFTSLHFHFHSQLTLRSGTSYLAIDD